MRPEPLHRFAGTPAQLSDVLFVLLLLAAGLLASSVHAQTPTETETSSAGDSLAFEIDNIRSREGKILIQVCDDPESFDGNGTAHASLILPAQSDRLSVRIEGYPPGEYAIRVMHDLDGDGELKTNMVGMPKEPWGMSNNAKGRFGPPKWNDAKFSVPSERKQTITLNK